MVRKYIILNASYFVSKVCGMVSFFSPRVGEKIICCPQSECGTDKKPIIPIKLLNFIDKKNVPNWLGGENSWNGLNKGDGKLYHIKF